MEGAAIQLTLLDLVARVFPRWNELYANVKDNLLTLLNLYNCTALPF